MSLSIDMSQSEQISRGRDPLYWPRRVKAIVFSFNLPELNDVQDGESMTQYLPVKFCRKLLEWVEILGYYCLKIFFLEVVVILCDQEKNVDSTEGRFRIL